MVQLIVNIPSAEDARLIQELLARFDVEVQSFEEELGEQEMEDRIQKALEQADAGETTPWEEVKANLEKRIESYRK